MQKILTLSLFLGMIAGGCSSEKSSPLKPNVIIIYADDLGYGDLSSYGGTIPTPNIDRVGEEGIRFTDFYVAAPACTPSRYSLLTGRIPQRSMHGLDDVIMPGDDYHFDESEKTIAELLKSQGYQTGLIGKWHLGSEKESYLPGNHGFDMFTGMRGGALDYFYHVYGSMGRDWYVQGNPTTEEGYATDLITDHAVNFIDEKEKNTNPFFLYLSYNAPHYGKTDPDSVHEGTLAMKQGKYRGKYGYINSLQAPPEIIEKFDHIDDPYRKVYAAMVANLDNNVGLVLEKLKDEGLFANTMIWFISDNGGYSESYHGHSSNGSLRGEKGSVWEGGIRVPALVSWKNKIEAGQVIHQPLSTLDILPMLGSITGYENNLNSDSTDGIDISPVLFEAKKIERDLFWKFRGQHAFRKGKWKLVDGEKLYDLTTDISEENNVASDYPEKVKELRKAYKETNATLKPNGSNE